MSTSDQPGAVTRTATAITTKVSLSLDDIAGLPEDDRKLLKEIKEGIQESDADPEARQKKLGQNLRLLFHTLKGLDRKLWADVLHATQYRMRSAQTTGEFAKAFAYSPATKSTWIDLLLPL